MQMSMPVVRVSPPISIRITTACLNENRRSASLPGGYVPRRSRASCTESRIFSERSTDVRGIGYKACDETGDGIGMNRLNDCVPMKVDIEFDFRWRRGLRP